MQQAHVVVCSAQRFDPAWQHRQETYDFKHLPWISITIKVHSSGRLLSIAMATLPCTLP